MTRDEFIKTLGPIAVKIFVDATREGVFSLFPSARIAQSIQETGGHSIPPSLNLFGYKRTPKSKTTAFWDGSYDSHNTFEYDENGHRYDIVATFKRYTSVYNAYRDQDLLFINWPANYQRVLDAKTPEDQIKMLQACKYATDPNYSKQVIVHLNNYNLHYLDKMANDMIAEEAENMKAIEELQQQVAELKGVIAGLSAIVESKDAPAWAKTTVDKLVAAKLMQDPTVSYDLARALVILDKAGVFGEGVKPNELEAKSKK